MLCSGLSQIRKFSKTDVGGADYWEITTLK